MKDLGPQHRQSNSKLCGVFFLPLLALVLFLMSIKKSLSLSPKTVISILPLASVFQKSYSGCYAKSGWGKGVIFEADRAHRRLFDGPGQMKRTDELGLYEIF